MLHLKTAAGERLEIIASSILAVFKPCDHVQPSAIIFDMGTGMQFEALSDQYGFVKKAVIDNMAMINPIEVRLVEGTQIGVDTRTGQPVMAAPFNEGRLFIPRDMIVGRREIVDDPNGIKAKLFLDMRGKRMVFNVADTLDEMDGVEPADGRAEADIARLDPPSPPSILAGESPLAGD